MNNRYKKIFIVLFDDMIIIKHLDPNNIKTDEKSDKNI